MDDCVDFFAYRVLGFRNTPYVVGRKINLLHEILPAASSKVSKQIVIKGNENIKLNC